MRPFGSQPRRRFALQSSDAIIDTINAWAIERDDIRAMALVGSWARGNARPSSDIDVLLLSDRRCEYRRRRRWLTEINFKGAGYRLRSSRDAVYGAVWSRHIQLLPNAEVEMTFAGCSWATTSPIDDGTRGVVEDALRIIIDKDGSLARLVDVITSARAQRRYPDHDSSEELRDSVAHPLQVFRKSSPA
jgi:uncharacterized protein